MEYQLIRSQRRTLAIKITPQAQVVVRAPLRADDQVIADFVRQRQDWICRAVDRQRARLAAYPPLTAEQEQALRRQAQEVIPPRVALWSRRMGLPTPPVKITAARTRFGSCSSRGSLCFSLHLLRYPPEAVDAVVVHELCHLRHADHSPAFYAEVERWLPDYPQRQKLLRP